MPLKNRKTQAELDLLAKFPDPVEYFYSQFDSVTINDEVFPSSTLGKIDFFMSDFDERFFSREIGERFKELCDKKRKKERSSEEWHEFNMLCLQSLRKKGEVIIKAYQEQFLPLVLEVVSLQEEILLTDQGSSSSFVGKSDVRLIFKDEPGVIVLCDHKVTTGDYSVKKVQESEQLAGYVEATGDKKAAYIIMPKKFNKRAPFCKIEVYRAEIPEKTKERVFEEIVAAKEGIENKDFKQNFNACYQYGSQCQFYQLCKYKTAKNLVKV